MTAPGVPPAGDVDLWTLSLPLPVSLEAALLPLLANEEQQRLSRFDLEGPRRQFLAGRALLRLLLARYGNVPVRQVRLAAGRQGKPLWMEGPVTFNLSHCDGLLLVGISAGMGVGIDVERVRPVPNARYLLQRYFTRDERRASAACEDQGEGFLRLWVCKEAALKAFGLGVSAGWGRLEVMMRDNISGRASGAGGDVPLRVLHPRPGYVAAVAADRDPLRIRSFNLLGPDWFAPITERGYP